MSMMPTPENPSPSMLKPALLVGVVCGVVGAIPYLRLLNCVCCLPAVLFGLLAAYMVSREQARSGGRFNLGHGALVGLLTGLFYGVTVAIVGAVFDATLSAPDTRAMLNWLRSMPNLPPQSQTALDQALQDAGHFSVGRFVLGLFLGTAVYAAFATLGGLIGGALFKRQTPGPAGPSAGTTSMWPAGGGPSSV